jgi:hypothetical protein
MLLKISALAVLLSQLTLLIPARAASNIDPEVRFAWSENAGWLNFLPVAARGVEVSDTYLSGFVWAENIGWIKLGADGGGPYVNTGAGNWGVNRGADGALSGFGWSENAGWINFSQITIDAGSGVFDGYAWSENIGWVHLSHSNPFYGVTYIPDTIFRDQFE